MTTLLPPQGVRNLQSTVESPLRHRGPRLGSSKERYLRYHQMCVFQSRLLNLVGRQCRPCSHALLSDRYEAPRTAAFAPASSSFPSALPAARFDGYRYRSAAPTPRYSTAQPVHSLSLRESVKSKAEWTSELSAYMLLYSDFRAVERTQALASISLDQSPAPHTVLYTST